MIKLNCKIKLSLFLILGRGIDMEDYLKLANSSIVFILAILLISFVLIQSIIFLIVAWRRGKEIGISRHKMMNTVKSSAIFSIVPSIPIVISLIAIIPILGIPFSWLRLSIIGSAPYELISADIGAKSMGIERLGAEGYTSEVFINSMWVMSIGIIWGLLMCIFFLRKYESKMKSIKNKDSKWMTILINSLFFGMLSVFLGSPIVKGGVSLLVLVSSGIIMWFITYIGKRIKKEWINNFSLAISMVGGMTLAILFTRVI
jgi:hypothetical protein